MDKQPQNETNTPIVRSKCLPHASMNNTVRLLIYFTLFVGLSGFIILFFVSGSLNGMWGIDWGARIKI